MSNQVVIFFHKNILDIYKEEWVWQCVESIESQTFKDFDIIELNYGGGQDRFTNGKFFSLNLRNHISAMNLLFEFAFSSGYTTVFNTNMDDWYEPKRLERQMSAINKGYQLVSSDFRYFGEIEKEMIMSKCGDIGANLLRGHNCIAHPVIAMHRSFWEDELHYRDLLGVEDLDLWKRAYKKGKKFFILPEILLNYRIHSNQITKEYGINGKKNKG